MNIILASQSPRRQKLLSLIGLDFKVVPAEVDESPKSGELPPEYVARLALVKARMVRNSQNANTVVVAADTTVVDGDQILGKPDNPLDAERMLRQLRGRVHQVYTGVAITSNGGIISELCGSDVLMRNFTDEELITYINSGDPFDKAGGYAIQHTSFHPVENFKDCYANVMGLPLCHLTRALQTLRINPKNDVPGSCQEYIGYQCPIYWKVLRES